MASRALSFVGLEEIVPIVTLTNLHGLAVAFRLFLDDVDADIGSMQSRFVPPQTNRSEASDNYEIFTFKFPILVAPWQEAVGLAVLAVFTCRSIGTPPSATARGGHMDGGLFRFFDVVRATR